jgi:Uma2 family endonuclease
MSTLATMPAMPIQPAGPIRIPSPLYRMTLEKYESLIASGVFNKRDRVHLINGYLVTRMAESPLHSAISEVIRLALQALLLAAWHIRGDKPLRIPAQSSMPEPDLVIVRGASWDYQARYPEPADVALVVEVSLSSLDEDRAMAEIYGKAGIAIYWIVNLVDGQVEVYTDPSPSGYRSHEVLAPGHVLSVVIDGVEIGEIPVSDILPRVS